MEFFLIKFILVMLFLMITCEYASQLSVEEEQ